MIALLAVALITLLASIVPGPDFAMVTRNSYLHGRRAGLLAALGIALGVQVHVFYTMFGVALLIAGSPALFTAIKLAGALYLAVIGWKTWANRAGLVIDLHGGASVPRRQILLNGFLTNALNPKTTLFVISTYTQVVQPGTSLTVQFGYGLCMSGIHLAWFALVAVFFSQARFRMRMVSHQRTIDRLIGAVLMALGVALACANMDKL
ncbi:LysE family translocator [Janthinobacterium lividum]|uniref:LysE family translocator n=1 Tax=Janthinobacterium lividum TaxID=29581 RepID=UPI000874E38F|nr:LysE family transporter [Janthinobacterium lividum]MCC7713555.1 LysE family transporter [Janthinobacterium lividum]OEZ52375.1 threonine efflux protein [Janthinobacterium lividum]WQE26618.1 LysE family transporter [Janthinobacterium lividum]STQ97509.1 Threonine efflux protein [Janthinobacterium lividum]